MKSILNLLLTSKVKRTQKINKRMNSNANIQRSHLEQLTKSLERLSIHDNGNRKALQAAACSEFQRILGDLDMETIKSRLATLNDLEKQAIEEDQLDDAKRINEEIKELREKEVLLTNFIIIERNQKAFDDLRQINEKQIQEFNNKWEGIIFEITEDSKRIERDMMEQHRAERARLEEGMLKVQMPHAKFSAELLNKKYKLKQMIKNKNFDSARELKEGIAVQENEERAQWIQRFEKQLVKRKDLLAVQHKNEYKALKTRLEKTINSKLKQRMTDYEKLLQRIQNLQSEMTLQQSLKFAKIQSTNAKLLAKYSVNLASVEERYADMPSNFDSEPVDQTSQNNNYSNGPQDISVSYKNNQDKSNQPSDRQDLKRKDGNQEINTHFSKESNLDKAKQNFKQGASGPQQFSKQTSITNDEYMKKDNKGAYNSETNKSIPIKNRSIELIQNVRAEEIFEKSFSADYDESDPSDLEGDEVPVQSLLGHYVIFS